MKLVRREELAQKVISSHWYGVAYLPWWKRLLRRLGFNVKPSIT